MPVSANLRDSPVLRPDDVELRRALNGEGHQGCLDWTARIGRQNGKQRGNRVSWIGLGLGLTVWPSPAMAVSVGTGFYHQVDYG
jgi:hypothetical protein